ncbi:MAG TPA: hypothetical protein VF624_13625, partial [Tepidisphaeraceae bacterium]
MRFTLSAAALSLLGASWLLAQSTQPASPQQMLGDMLKPTGEPIRPLQPIAEAAPTGSTAAGAVAPGGMATPTLREGSYLVDRVGRLTKLGEGYVFTLEADGRAMQDPPLVILPNLKLMLMENQVKDTSRDLRFRVTGMVTEYRGKNFVLLEKVVV